MSNGRRVWWGERRFGGLLCLLLCFAIEASATSEIVCDECPRFRPSRIEQVRLSHRLAEWVARGHFVALETERTNPHSDRREDEIQLGFRVEERRKGWAVSSPLTLELPSYAPRDAPGLAATLAHWIEGPSLESQGAALRELERAFGAHELRLAEYTARRERLREEILTSPSYHEGRHVLVRVEPSFGLGKIRSADVLLELGTSVHLMMLSEPPRYGSVRRLHPFGLDLYPATEALPDLEGVGLWESALEERLAPHSKLECTSTLRSPAIFIGTVLEGAEPLRETARAGARDVWFYRVRYRIEELLHGDLALEGDRQSNSEVEVRFLVPDHAAKPLAVPPELVRIGARVLVGGLAIARSRHGWSMGSYGRLPRLATPEEVNRIRRCVEGSRPN